jgi:tetratricopeptide (TPR) repeat protein
MGSESAPARGETKPLGKKAIFLVVGIAVVALLVALLVVRYAGKSAGGGEAGGSAGKPCLGVVPFRPASGSEAVAWMGDAVPVFLTLTLENDPDLRVLTPERIFDLNNHATLSGAAAELDMAQKGGADYLLRGEVSASAAGATLTASWVRVSSGKELEHWVVSGLTEDSLGRKLDELASHVRQALGRGPLQHEDPPLASLVPVKETPARRLVEAWTRLAQGDPAGAAAPLQEALQLEDFHLARYLEIQLAAQGGDPAAAARAATALSKLNRPLPDRVTLTIPVILALYQSGNPRTAVAPLQSFLARFPDEKAPLAWLGAIELFLLRQPAAAAKTLRRAHDLDPSNSDNLRLLALATMGAGNSKEAAGLLTTYLDGHPEDQAARLSLARAQRREHHPEEALRSVEQVLASQPENVGALALKGDLLLDEGKPAEAAALYRTLAGSPASRAEGLALQARVALLTGHVQEGLKNLRDASEAARQAGDGPAQGRYLLSLGRNLAALKRNQEALSTYSEVRGIETGPDPDLPIINILVAQKEFDNARRLLQEQVARWQGRVSADLLERLKTSLEGSISLEQGNYAEAVRQIEASLSPEDRDAPASETLGRALLGAGDAARAAQVFKRLLDDPDPYSDPIGYVQNLAHYGEACEKSGNTQEALRAYREVVRWWSGADFQLPELKAANEGLKRLGG